MTIEITKNTYLSLDSFLNLMFIIIPEEVFYFFMASAATSKNVLAFMLSFLLIVDTVAQFSQVCWNLFNVCSVPVKVFLAEVTALCKGGRKLSVSWIFCICHSIVFCWL